MRPLQGQDVEADTQAKLEEGRDRGRASDHLSERTSPVLMPPVNFQLPDDTIYKLRELSIESEAKWWELMRLLGRLEDTAVPQLQPANRVSKRVAERLFRREAAKALGWTRPRLVDDLRIYRTVDPDWRSEFPHVTKTGWRHVIGNEMGTFTGELDEVRLEFLAHMEAGQSVDWARAKLRKNKRWKLTRAWKARAVAWRSEALKRGAKAYRKESKTP